MHFYIFCLKFLTYADEDVIDKANEIILDKFLEQASIEHQIDNHDIIKKYRVFVGFYCHFSIINIIF